MNDIPISLNNQFNCKEVYFVDKSFYIFIVLESANQLFILVQFCINRDCDSKVA